jgi:hypothetical protein
VGFKTWSSGDVLTAADVNDYLMEQAVIACTSGTRPGSPNEGMTIFETDTDRLLIYSGSAWVRLGCISSTGRTGCVLQRAAAQTISATTVTTILFDSEILDSDGFITAPSGTITVPSGLAGVYAVSAALSWSAAGTSGSYMTITAPAGRAWPQEFTSTQIGNSTTVGLAAGDTVTLSVYHVVGGTVTAHLEMYRLAG